MWHLLWKEWHEQAWNLAFGSIVLGLFALIGLHSRIIADETIMMWVCVAGMALLPVLASTSLIPAERAEGSFEALLALPVSPSRILSAKTIIGLLLCAGPMLVAAVVSLIVAGGREMYTVTIINLYSRCIATGIWLFIWMLALTSRLPSEARAALVALGVLIFWMLATQGLVRQGVPQVLLSASPLVFVRTLYAGPDNGFSFWTGLLLPMAIITGVWAATVRSFSSIRN